MISYFTFFLSIIGYSLTHEVHSNITERSSLKYILNFLFLTPKLAATSYFSGVLVLSSVFLLWLSETKKLVGSIVKV